MTFLSMSQKDIFRYDIIMNLIRKEINGTEASEILNLSKRQVRRIKGEVLKNGASGLIHGNRGKPSNKRIPDKERGRIAKIIKKSYPDFGPTLAWEELVKDHDVEASVNTVRSIMISENIWKLKSKKKKQKHRQWRQRKANYGQMEQFDGSYEHWFEDRGPECCLLLSMDDAAGKITHAKFDTDEGLFPVCAFWIEYLQKHGKPLSIYTDKFSTYKMNQKVAIENHDTKTQFQRAMDQLNIEAIFAHSPQAKGRVERSFGTIQDRLIKYMRLHNISDIQSANEFLEKTFIPLYNQRFSVKPRNKANLHRKLSKKENLNSILSKHTERTIMNDFTISINNQWHQILPTERTAVYKQDKIIVEEHVDNTLHIRKNSKYLNHKPIPKGRKYTKKMVPWVLTMSTVKQADIARV